MKLDNSMSRSEELRLRARLAKMSAQASAALDAVDADSRARDVKQVQTRRFDDMFKFVVEHSSFYRTFYGDHGLFSLGTVHVQDLPVLTKELLMENFDSIVTVSGITKALVNDHVARGEDWIYGNKYLFIKSTGTSGYHTLNVLTLEEMARIVGLINRRLGKPAHARPRTAFLFGRDPSHLSYKFSCISLPYLNEARHIPTQQKIEAINSDLEAFEPNAISSFPSTLRVVIDEVKHGRLRLSPGITVMSSGEMLDPELIADFQTYLGTTPFNMYACIEAAPIALDCSRHALHVNEDWFVVEPSSEGGIVTNLLNRTIPILKFRFDDLFAIDRSPCECGASFARLTLADAKRTGQFFIKNRFGQLKKVNTMIFKDVLYKFPAVVQSQIEQTSPRHFLVRTHAPGASSELKNQILARLSEELCAFDLSAEELEVELRLVDPSEMRASNGKVKHFIPWRWPAE